MGYLAQYVLDKRIPLRGTDDEWDRVAENLNRMLDRIETLMGEVKQVSDVDLAHGIPAELDPADLRLRRTDRPGSLRRRYAAGLAKAS